MYRTCALTFVEGKQLKKYVEIAMSRIEDTRV